MARPTKVLIAEDDKDDQELIEESLKQVTPGIDLHITDHGREVLNYLQACAPRDFPCLIVLDYNMPDINGAEVLKLLSADERFQHIPAVILSTSNASLYQDVCLRNGARKFYQKPDSFTEMLEISKNMLAYCD